MGDFRADEDLGIRGFTPGSNLAERRRASGFAEGFRGVWGCRTLWL